MKIDELRQQIGGIKSSGQFFKYLENSFNNITTLDNYLRALYGGISRDGRQQNPSYLRFHATILSIAGMYGFPSTVAQLKKRPQEYLHDFCHPNCVLALGQYLAGITNQIVEPRKSLYAQMNQPQILYTYTIPKAGKVSFPQTKGEYVDQYTNGQIYQQRFEQNLPLIPIDLILLSNLNQVPLSLDALSLHIAFKNYGCDLSEVGLTF